MLAWPYPVYEVHTKSTSIFNSPSNMSTNTDPPPPYQAQDPTANTTISHQSAKPTVYHVRRSFAGDYKFLQDDRIPAFYVETQSVRTPDLIVHRGASDLGKTVAHCKYSDLGSHYDVGMFRDPNDKRSLVWAKMTSDCRFTAIVPAPGMTVASLPNGYAQRPFIWKRTSSLKLVDEETGLVAAEAYEKFASTKCCVLEIRVSYGDGFTNVVVTTFLAIYEKQWRDAKHHSGGFTRHHPGRAHAGAMHGAIAGSIAGSIAGGGGGGGC